MQNPCSTGVGFLVDCVAAARFDVSTTGLDVKK